MSHDSPHPAIDSDEWSTKEETGAAQEHAAMNLFCRSMLVATIVLGVLFVVGVTYLAVIHSSG